MGKTQKILLVGFLCIVALVVVVSNVLNTNSAINDAAAPTREGLEELERAREKFDRAVEKSKEKQP